MRRILTKWCALGCFLVSSAMVMGQGVEDKVPTVLTSTVTVLDDAEARKFAGAVVAIEEVDVVPRVNGYIESINFKEGDYVQEGDLLFEIEDREYTANLTSAKVQASVCEATILQFSAAIKQQEAKIVELDALIKYQEVTHKRNQELFKNGNAVSEDQVDLSLSTLNATRAQKEAALASIDAAKAQLAAAEANLDAAHARVDLAQFDMEHTRILALISGKIGKVSVTKGNLVSPQSGKLVNIKKVSPIYVRFAISERLFRSTYGGEKNIRDRALIRLQLADDSIYPEEAKIALIDNKVDSKTNTIMIWATLQNSDQQLFPGSYATVLLSPKSDKPNLGVLLSAVTADDKGSYVYVIDSSNKAVRRDIVLGDICGNYHLIVSGVKAGEVVVCDGTNKVIPGKEVLPVRYEDEEKRLDKIDEEALNSKPQE